MGSVLPAAKLKLTTKDLIMLNNMTQFILQATYIKSFSHREKKLYLKKNSQITLENVNEFIHLIYTHILLRENDQQILSSLHIISLW